MKLGDVFNTLLESGALSPTWIPARPESEAAAPPVRRDADSAIEIHSVHYDSRQVVPGGLFVAIPGFKADGHRFISDALARGAVAVVTEKPFEGGVPGIRVANARKALAAVSNAFHGRPSHKLHITGVTGTNGKTTTTYLIESMLLRAGFQAGVIGTVNYRYRGNLFANPVTTPESLDLQRILAEMAGHGVTHIVMEVSSHAIDLSRVDFTDFDVGVFTNLSQDHLDYHRDMDAYWCCKKRFFTHLLNAPGAGKHPAAVLNIDNQRGREIAAELPCDLVTVGRASDSMVRPVDVRMDLAGIRGSIATPHGSFAFSSALAGAYNLENILCAAGAGTALHLPLEAIRSGIEITTRVPGRLERVPSVSGPAVYVDYAHTPDALRNALQSLRDLDPNRLICIFGCGGDRDRGKRASMGEIAAGLCDLVVVTSDNPRTEDPRAIIDQIMEGVGRVRARAFQPADLAGGLFEKGYVVEPDRKTAIQVGIHAAGPGDTVLIAGKGHETYQIIGERRLPFDDRIVAETVLADRTAQGQLHRVSANALEGNH